MGTTTAQNAQQKTRQFTIRDGRLVKLRKYREVIAIYVRFCDAGETHAERAAKWPTDLRDAERQIWIAQNDVDQVTAEVISAATRVVAEIGLHSAPIDPAACLDSLRETLGRHVDHKVFEDVLAHATSLMQTARSRFVEQGERSGRAHTLAIPRLIEPEDIAKAVSLTKWRKHTIWGSKIPIEEVDARPKSDIYHSNWTKEQHREHRELAKRFNRKPETIADWRRGGEDAFATKVAEMQAKLLDDDMIAFYALPGEHPFDTSKRVHSEREKAEKKLAGRKKKPTVTDRVRLWAKLEEVHESTVWRDNRAVRAMSRFASENVTFESENEPVSRGLDVGGPQKTELWMALSRLEVRERRLSKRARSELKERHLERTGRVLTDAAIRKRRERGTLTQLILELSADQENAAKAPAMDVRGEAPFECPF